MASRPRRVTQTVIDIRHTPLRGRDWLLIVVMAVIVLTAAFAGRGALFASLNVFNPHYLVRRVEYGRYREMDDIYSSYARALAWRDKTTDMVIFGSSAAREALWQEGVLEAQLSALAGRSIRVADLTSSGQGPGEMLVLLDTLRLKPGTTVLMVLSPSRLYRQFNATYGVLPSDIPVDQLSLDDSLNVETPAIQDTVPAIERYAITAEALRRVFYRWLQVWPTNYLRQHVYGITPPPRDTYLYLDLPYGNSNKRALHYREVITRMNLAGEKDVRLNGELILASARRIRAAGGNVIVVDAPMIAGEDAAFYGAACWQVYRTLITRLHATTAVAVVDINDAAALGAQDFYDSTHVGKSGRRKWSKAFVRKVGPLLQQSPQGM